MFRLKELVILQSKEAVIRNEFGLFARPATFFIQKANEFRSTVWIEFDDKRVNAKSLLGVLSLGVVQGSKIKIIAEGSDEEDAVNSMIDLVKDGFVKNGIDEENGFGGRKETF
jgi:phosphocarrier protein